MNKIILLIDYDVDEFELFVEALHEVQFTYDCIFAQTADQALNLLCYTVPDFIFMEYDMPKINGLKCLSRIKLLITIKDIPIVLYSTNITDEICKTAILNGATLCIKKPDTIYALSEILHQVLANEWRN